MSHYNQTKRYNNFIPFHYIQFFVKEKRYKIVQSYLDIKLQQFTSLISKDTCKNFLFDCGIVRKIPKKSVFLHRNLDEATEIAENDCFQLD